MVRSVLARPLSSGGLVPATFIPSPPYLVPMPAGKACGCSCFFSVLQHPYDAHACVCTAAATHAGAPVAVAMVATPPCTGTDGPRAAQVGGGLDSHKEQQRSTAWGLEPPSQPLRARSLALCPIARSTFPATSFCGILPVRRLAGTARFKFGITLLLGSRWSRRKL